MALTVLYATETDLDNILSPFGVQVRTDDTDSGSTDESIISAVLTQASSDINFYLFQRYPLSTLAPGGTPLVWVEMACSFIAAKYLCMRRGNPVPEQVEEKYQQVIEALRDIEAGKRQLPADSGLANPQFDDTPAISNYTYSEWYMRTKVRRVPATSTGGPQTPNRKQYNAPDYWLFPFI